MTNDVDKPYLKHAYAVQASQRLEDKVVFEKDGYFTPEIYFTNGRNGLWNAHMLRGFIVRMGYQAEIDISPAKIPGRGVEGIVLKVGQIPARALDDIKDFMSIKEIETNKAHFCVQMDENGVARPNAETAMFHAFKALKKDNNKDKPRPNPV